MIIELDDKPKKCITSITESKKNKTKKTKLHE